MAPVAADVAVGFEGGWRGAEAERNGRVCDARFRTDSAWFGLEKLKTMINTENTTPHIKS